MSSGLSLEEFPDPARMGRQAGNWERKVKWRRQTEMGKQIWSYPWPHGLMKYRQQCTRWSSMLRRFNPDSSRRYESYCSLIYPMIGFQLKSVCVRESGGGIMWKVGREIYGRQKEEEISDC